MPRIADALERESRTVDLEQGDFERLLGRRERKQRNRRIRAGALGVIVALAIGAIFVRSLTSDPIPVDPPVVPRPAPAESGALAYTFDGDIYVADPGGSNAVKIADGRPLSECQGTGEYWAEGSIWSPDGRYLAYRGADCDGLQEGAWSDVVFISDAEGNIVASFPADGWNIGWSPDSTRVAVWDDLFETIGVYGVDGARQTQLTMPSGLPAGGDYDPMWMPDGTSLMVDNVEVPLDGGAPRKLPWGAEAYSPDGSHVAYADRRSLTVARSDGSQPREVFGDWTGDPTWSPTGDRIAFTTNDELRIIDVASGSVTLLTEAEPGTSLGVIGFSPGGGRILFRKTEDRGAHESSLRSIGIDGSDARLLVAGPLYGDWFVPSVMSDDIPEDPPVDRRSAPEASGLLAYARNGDIYVADADGSNAVRIADGRPAEDCGKVGGYWAEGSMWSPDGRYLAYRYSDCSGGAAEFRPGGVVISDAEGNVLARFPAQGWNIVWSPDSTRVAVWDVVFETIGVYGLDGARQTQLTMPPNHTGSGDYDPVWMPDGTSLMVPNGSRIELPLDGGTPQQLPLPAGAWSTTYSPDGSRVAYVENDSLVLAAADGSDAREMVGSWSDDPVWSPTGDRIAFTYSETRVRGSNELRVLDVATGEVTPLFGLDGSAEIGGVQFSPKGDRMLFVMKNSLWTINADGSHARRVVAGTIQGDLLSR